MRKNLLAKSVATMIAGFGVVSAHAIVVLSAGSPPANTLAATTLEINDLGIGHSLLVPYYTVQGENVTLFNIQNTDMLNGKAVKVRFRGAENSDDVYDITVLLSPGDVWGGAISRDSGTPGVAKLFTTDKTCTLPNIVNQSFVLSRLTGAGQTSASTLEGYVEVFNMADIPPIIPAGAAVGPFGGALPGTTNPLFTAIKHVNGTPPGCASAAVNLLFNDPATTPNAEAFGLGNPTTGMMGSWAILVGSKGAGWSAQQIAVEAREADGARPGFGNNVFFPQSSNPVLLANVKLYTSDPILRGGVGDPAAVGPLVLGPPAVAASLFDFPDMSTPYLNSDIANLANGNATRRQAFRLSRALAVSSVSNEFLTGSGISALTDWTLSSPSRRYNVARNYLPQATPTTVFTDLSRDDANVATVAVPVTGGLTIAPYNFYNTLNTTVTTANANGLATPYGVICVTGTAFAAGNTGSTALSPDNLISGQNVDREEGAVGVQAGSFVVSPGTPSAPPRSLCGEVSVVSFNGGPIAPATLYPTSVLNAQLTRFDITSPNVAGWARIATPGLVVAAGQGLGVTGVTSSTRGGLPIIGHAMIQFTNNNASAGGAADRVIGNFDQTFRHRGTAY